MVPTAEVLITAGFHVPVTGGTSMDTAGKVVGTALRQNGPINANVGCSGFVIVMAIVTCGAHIPGVGVNV